MAREMFPGKANSLDALCKRLEVDNSEPQLHGALLDAGLLAEVYIRMTAGRTRWSSTRPTSRQRQLVDAVDLGPTELPVLLASPD
jgi:DNA polymerase III subunit epsilon